MTPPLPMHDFTVVYTFTKRHEQYQAIRLACHHHIARVKAPSIDLAIERCRADMFADHTFALIAIFEGTPRMIESPLSTRIQEFTHGEPV